MARQLTSNFIYTLQLPYKNMPSVHSIVTYCTPEHTKDWLYDPLLKAVASIGGYWLKWSTLYDAIKEVLDTSETQRMRGVVGLPDGREITETNFRGMVRSWVEERSPYSRQHYFRAGKRTKWTEYQRPKLFVNVGLGRANEMCDWKPYRAARGDGWILYPKMASEYSGPSEEQLVKAERLYLKKGMRGSNRVKAGIVGTGVIYQQMSGISMTTY
jgi:hypothetical protein